MQKTSPFLWFDSEAEEAAQFYATIFKNSRIARRVRYSASAAKIFARPEGSILAIIFDLDGQRFTAMNGGPALKSGDAVSFYVQCETQAEVDAFWERLSEGGETGQCGWLKDRFGIAWQIVPAALSELLASDDTERSKRVMAAMLTMTKPDIRELERAAEDA